MLTHPARGQDIPVVAGPAPLTDEQREKKTLAMAQASLIDSSTEQSIAKHLESR